jgi:predicted permease
MFESPWNDVRFGARMLSKSPGFTSVAVLSLALGIGANTAVFTFIDALLLRTLPVTRPEELVEVSAHKRGEFALLSFPMYRDLRDRQDVFTDILATAGETPYRLTISETGASSTELDNMRVSSVSGNYFAVLGVGPSLGRVISPEDDRNPNSSETLGSVIVLSDDFWERQFGRDPRVLDRTIAVGRSPCKVIGVAPRGFFGEAVGAAPVGWVPLVPFSGPDNLENRRGNFTGYVARLRSGVTLDQAQSAMTLAFQQLLAAERRVRDPIRDYAIGLKEAGTGLDFGLRRRYAAPLKIVMGIVATVLLIACANVANLLMARATARRGEIGVRLAIGCSRARLVRQLLAESVLLSTAGALAGVAVAYIGVRALLGLVDSGPIPVHLDLAPNVSVLAFLLAIGVVTGIGFGLVPALRAARVDLAPSLQGVRRGDASSPVRQRLGRALVSAQVALSLLLLIGAGLLIRSFANLHRVDWGFRPEQVVIFDLAHNPASREPAALADVARGVEQRVKELPGVQSASVSGLLLFSPSDIMAPLRIRGYTPPPDERLVVRFNSVSPGYFGTIGMRLIEGRGIEDRDGPSAPFVAVINQSMGRRYFPDGSAVGRIFELDATRADTTTPRKPIEVIGVVHDAKYNSVRQDAKPMFYMPIAQLPRSLRSLEVRTTEPLGRLASPVRHAIAEVSKDVMIRRVVSLSDQVDQSLTAERLTMKLCGLFSVFALLLAGIGLYGVLSYSVAQRTSEIGIRMALGASSGGVIWLIVRDSLGMVGLGIVFGVPAALAAGRFVSSLLYGLSIADPTTMGLAVAMLASAATLAAYLPSRRAVLVDPMVALRDE